MDCMVSAYRRFRISSGLMAEAAAFLTEEFLPDISGQDILIGYRADDSYFSFARDFIGNAISLEQLSEAMYLGDLGEQVVLKSEQAFRQIYYRGSSLADKNMFYPLRMSRDQAARKRYREITGRHDSRGIFIMDLLRGEVKPDDPRLRGNVSG